MCCILQFWQICLHSDLVGQLWFQTSDPLEFCSGVMEWEDGAISRLPCPGLTSFPTSSVLHHKNPHVHMWRFLAHEPWSPQSPEHSHVNIPAPLGAWAQEESSVWALKDLQSSKQRVPGLQACWALSSGAHDSEEAHALAPGTLLLEGSVAREKPSAGALLPGGRGTGHEILGKH